VRLKATEEEVLMSLGDVIKEGIDAAPNFAQEFINLVGAPRAYAAGGHVFNSSRFAHAINFLGISLVATYVIKYPMFRLRPDIFMYLASDAVWKFVVVLVVTAVITLSWRMLGRKGGVGHYFVANCLYFGVFSVLGHLVLLLCYAVDLRFPALANGVLVVTSVPLLFWTLACWRTYGDFNQARTYQTVVALLVVLVISLPALAIGYVLHDVLINSLSGESVPLWETGDLAWAVF
jgi:hypothetical protein